jgi:hypothetical protein
MKQNHAKRGKLLNSQEMLCGAKHLGFKKTKRDEKRPDGLSRTDLREGASATSRRRARPILGCYVIDSIYEIIVI